MNPPLKLADLPLSGQSMMSAIAAEPSSLRDRLIVESRQIANSPERVATSSCREHCPALPDRRYFTDSDAANELIATDPMALLIGFSLDQQVDAPGRKARPQGRAAGC